MQLHKQFHLANHKHSQGAIVAAKQTFFQTGSFIVKQNFAPVHQYQVEHKAAPNQCTNYK